MAGARTHFLLEGEAGTACGIQGARASPDSTFVTCKNCLKWAHRAGLPVQQRTDEPNPFRPARQGFYTKIAGVTHSNDDRSSRQWIVTKCRIGDELRLEREPNNQVDPGAIKVLTQEGQRLGYIPAHVARHGDVCGLAGRIDRGFKHRCRISDLTGGGPGESRRVNIHISEGTEGRYLIDAPSVPRNSASEPSHPALVAVWIIIGAGLFLAAVLAYVQH